MRVILDRVSVQLNTEQVAEYALNLRYHFNGVASAFEKYGPVRIAGPSDAEALHIAQMLNRSHTTRAILDHLGIRVHARGLFLLVVSDRSQLQAPDLLHTLGSIEKFRMPGSKLLH